MPTNPPGYMKAYYARLRRALIMELSGGVCQRCGDTDFSRLEIHHKNPCRLGRGRGRTDRLTEWKRDKSNLRVLCPECHIREQQESEMSYGNHVTV